MARTCAAPLEHLSDHDLTEALARTPADQYVIWNGRTCAMRAGSIPARTLSFVDRAWVPVPLRVLVTRAARLSGTQGLHPDSVRKAVRMHQSSGQVSYFLVRRTASGDYVAVADVASPSSERGRLNAGDVVLGRSRLGVSGSPGALRRSPGADADGLSAPQRV